eukprot:CAMPEP_0168724102 /NCGR_PEP_ID=MMETSP0724-20121128/3462_1 /TAXON_ID=265536 /ORGANISM="Amphiprora sp., Strain CCMP467" /LENGTH=547 /DNA_ID=CAMNT_0008770839 /DNA_START=103 /DNA_END=1743 /DNA_ORIENTATION=-
MAEGFTPSSSRMKDHSNLQNPSAFVESQIRSAPAERRIQHCLTWKKQQCTRSTQLFAEVASSLETTVQCLDAACTKLTTEKNSIVKVCKVKPAISEDKSRRLGLVVTQSVSKGDALLSIPYKDMELTTDLALQTFAGILPDKYDGWTGDTGLIALALLNELAQSSGEAGVPVKDRVPMVKKFLQTWVASLPSPVDDDKSQYPLLWSEEDQEILQSSSTSKIYRILDDIEEDAIWLEENVFAKDRAKFPETVNLDGVSVPCFSLAGFTWAMAMVQSRSFFLDKTLRLIPFLDMVNHADDAEEIRSGTMGTFGTIKGAVLVAGKSYKAGEEVFCSYGPKSAIDYLIEHGFVPDQCWRTKVSELTFELDPEDRFYDDKLDILEFETYDSAPMDPTQSFDLVAAPGQDGEPDPSLVQFMRLCYLGGTDAFLLESIFRKDVWGFMSMPVSEQNEMKVVNAISEACETALKEFDECPDKEGPEICQRVRDSERAALDKTLSFLKREKEALDLKEYYQERRLKDLGLDSDWSPEDEMMGEDMDLGYGQTRAPGG